VATGVRHPLFARVYERVALAGERSGAAGHRRELLAGLAGRVIEVGAGSGTNFAHYPDTVSGVLAVEPEPYLREKALGAAARAPVPVEVVPGRIEQIPAPAESFDAAVLSLMLCSVADQDLALGEAARVLRPGGELRFYEHVVAESPVWARAQRIADATLWPRMAGGCHMARDTAAAIERAGFQITSCERFVFSAAPPLPGFPHILGVARLLSPA
jgi:ubiquinone/menaquinone biosynthesis C-methylase UbiE